MVGESGLRFGVASIALATGWTGAASAAEDTTPWRLEQALAAPEWLSIGGSYRARYETLSHPYRANASGSDEIFVSHLLLSARIATDTFYAQLELEDSRQRLADSRSAIGTDSVNTLEPLQALVGMRFNDAFTPGGRLDVSAGRMTIDPGGRRLVSRNNFRNTTNSYTGVHALWKGAVGQELRAFYVLPVQRRPADLQSLLDNDHELDRESSDVSLWGVFGAVPETVGHATAEAYWFGLRSRDQPGIAAADRDIYTPGFRLIRRPAAQSWDFETEAAYQFGTSRLTTAAADRNDLQHRAGFFHGEIGYTWRARMSPRLELSYDYASGDEDPTDNENNRFDTLYGSRRFDFGHTGIYGALARSNINSPGLRVEAKPLPKVAGMFGYRAVWLASDRDQYTTARLQDPSGDSGSFVGHQLEWLLQYNARPGNLVLEVGGAHLAHGHFLEHAPNAPSEGDSTYFYASAMTTF
ncbi:alginate export family protein [Steroidobacter sp. S1-65]|uniref:Alginate export family protein n=2 Tax=Steroidobacter gossypii TaxID=2805490 RepID=A0ABS1X0V5_9GAMM|nr:alginate export family protein [Steroidobacter gossypii]